MTGSFFKAFLTGGLLLCALMILLWLTRIRSRGVTAYLMAGAFAMFGALLYSISIEADLWIRVLLSAALGLLLVADFVVRAGRQAGGSP